MSVPDYEPEIEEFIPDDGFEHDKGSTNCPCNPEFYSLPWMGSGIIHRRMLDDKQIEEWLK